MYMTGVGPHETPEALKSQSVDPPHHPDPAVSPLLVNVCVQDRSWFGAPVTSRIWKLRSVARWLIRTHLYAKNNPVHIGAII